MQSTTCLTPFSIHFPPNNLTNPVISHHHQPHLHSSHNTKIRSSVHTKTPQKNPFEKNPNINNTLLNQLYSSSNTKTPQKEAEEAQGISTNMWWADLKAAFGQRFNLEGIVCVAGVVSRHRHLAIPHVSVPDIRYIDWAELRRRGFKGVVFDKDNTITAPYSLALWDPLRSSLDRCKTEFGDNIAVFSNSAGLYEYDPDGSKARSLEGAIGIQVIRHRVKKPAGTAEEIEKHFDCESSLLIMVGDRRFTDIVYGNQNGFLTIFTEPLSPSEEPFIVKQVRKLEASLVNKWYRRGLKPTSHDLLPDATQCINDPPPL